MSAPFKRLLVLDFESTWSRREKLGFSCQTNEEYLRDPRFKAWGLCWKDLGDEGKGVWVRRKDLQRWADSINWSETGVIAQNAMFDCSILSWHYNAHPAFIIDTLSMARATRGVEVGNSLAKLAADFGLPPKGNELSSTENILDELPFAIEQDLARYCAHDTWLCEQIFLRMRPGYPTKELKLIDLTLKMYTEPKLVLDAELLTTAIEDERTRREDLLQRLGVDESELASNPKFALVLEALGVAAPIKTSKTTGQPALALAKNDAHFQALLNGEREDVALLCEARLRVKSTGERTRAQRFLDISSRGALPVPLSYFGAITGRWTASKGSAINMQNLKRGGVLRKALMAPEGYTLVVGDLSQIEPRVLAWLAEYEDLLDIFRSGGDPYAQFGEGMFRISGMTKESHPLERQSAKSALLGAGYMLGWASFAAQLLVGFLGADPVRYTKADAIKLGVTQASALKFLSWDENVTKMQAIPHNCTEQELLFHCLAAKAIIDSYRATAEAIAGEGGFWKLLDSLILHSLYEGNEYTHKCLTFRKEEIILPSGMSIRYPDLKQSKDKKGRTQWTYGPDSTKLYAGKCLAEGTLVLTDSGWVPIERVQQGQLVHDGVEFVKHGGKVFNGVQFCITLDGVDMTPDHKVLTHDGWQDASHVQEPYRPNLRHVDSGTTRQCYQQEMALAVSLRMRKACSEEGLRGNERSEARGDSELRLFDAEAYKRRKQSSRHDAAPGVHCLAQHAQSLHKAVGACLQKLWRKGDIGVRCVGAVRRLLGGYGEYVPAGPGFGSYRQQRELRSGELSLGISPREQYESAINNSRRRCTRAEQGYRNSAVNAVLPPAARMVFGRSDDTAQLQKPVYDILYAGPRKRFVVLGRKGPFIVHNCTNNVTQAVARCVMTDGMLRVAERYPVVGTVHDEQIVMVPDAELHEAKRWVLEQMIVTPKYLPGIPLNADVGAHRRYGIAKQ